MLLDAMITYDRSIGTREAFMQESASCVSFSDMRVGSAGPTREAPTRQGPPAGSCIFEEGESAGQIHGFDPRVSEKQPTGRGGLTRVFCEFIALDLQRYRVSTCAKCTCAGPLK